MNFRSLAAALIGMRSLRGSVFSALRSNREFGRDVVQRSLRAATIDGLIGPNGWYRPDAPRYPLVIQSILNFGPDLLGVQEPYNYQVADLRAGLSDYGFVGVGRNDGDEEGEFCGIFYRQDRFTLVDAGNFWLSDTPSACRHVVSSRRRSAHCQLGQTR